MNSAARERTPETSSLTNPANRVRTVPVPGQALKFQFAPENRALAISLRTDVQAASQKRRERHLRYKNPPPCRTAPRRASNTPDRGRRDTSPYIARTESARARGFPAEFSRAGSQPLPLAIRPVLRRANEHFDQIIVQRVVKLALEGPLELRMIQIAGMKLKIICMHRYCGILELNDDFHSIAFSPRREVQQRMLIELQLR